MPRLLRVLKREPYTPMGFVYKDALLNEEEISDSIGGKISTGYIEMQRRFGGDFEGVSIFLGHKSLPEPEVVLDSDDNYCLIFHRKETK